MPTITVHEAMQATVKARRDFMDLVRAMETDLVTLRVLEYGQTQGLTPVSDRAADRLMALVALYDPTMLQPDPEYVPTGEQYDFPG